jgi:uncharacterized protein
MKKSPDEARSERAGDNINDDIKTKKDDQNLEKIKSPNRLIKEKSQYLLQHSFNPVDWYPWGDEAFDKAKRENKPIFLSIGYSTCHWCHVMERESFEDPEVSKLINEVFVSIKVDREERPDIDNIYMNVCQLMTGGGGWPLTIILTPTKEPFFAGTYFPKVSRFGHIGILDLVPWIERIWKDQKDDVEKTVNQVYAAMNKIDSDIYQKEELHESILGSAYEDLAKRFDEEYGGFGRAPKFPIPHNFLFLLRYWKRFNDEHALKMVEDTLYNMRIGGIFDHVGYGFHRYSTDQYWKLPHFEKMLYDQALLLMAYTETFQVTKQDKYRKVADEIITYVLTDMTSSDGCFYSAEDADSDGIEGKFYIWTLKEIYDSLQTDEADLIISTFNLRRDGNFYEEASGERTGENILYLDKSYEDLAKSLNLTSEELNCRLNNSLKKLFEVRKKRTHPLKDDKILTDWNGLMIAALSKAASVFDRIDYVDAAKKASDFIFSKMIDENKTLMHRYRDGEAAKTVFLDDYAFMILGLIELYETTFEIGYLQKALELQNDMIDKFWDKENNGFFMTPNNAEKLIIRQKEIYDGALPSGNSVGMLNLLRLARMTGNIDFEEKANKISQLFSSIVKKSPSQHTQLLIAVDFALGPSYEIVIVGKKGSKDTNKLIKDINAKFIPNKVVLFKATDEDKPGIIDLAPYTRTMTEIEGKAAAYICKNFVCSKPTTDLSNIFSDE